MSKLGTFEQAEKLKYLGFRKNCLHYYNYDGKEKIEEAYFFDNEERVFVHDLYEDFNDSNYIYSAPTVSDALDWIREEKGIACGAYPNIEVYDEDIYPFIGYSHVYYNGTEFIKGDDFDTHPLASSALLDAVLDYLEKKEIDFITPSF